MIDIAPAGKGGGPSPFVNAFDHPAVGSLRYNTSQAGSAVPICYGTQRVTINLIEFWGFSGANGGKGGKGLGSSSGKKGSNQQYSVDVAFGICQGPAAFTGSTHGLGGNNRIWANGGIAAGLATVGFNGYIGTDGQSPDPVFVSGDQNQPVSGIPALATSPERRSIWARRRRSPISRSKLPASPAARPGQTSPTMRGRTKSSPICCATRVTGPGFHPRTSTPAAP